MVVTNVPVSFCCIPFWITVWFIPESPVYLMSKGKCQQAALVLDKLGHSEERFLQLQEKTQAERASGSLMSGSTLTQAIKLLTKPTTIKPFLTGVLLMIFFQVKRKKVPSGPPKYSKKLDLREKSVSPILCLK